MKLTKRQIKHIKAAINFYTDTYCNEAVAGATLSYPEELNDLIKLTKILKNKKRIKVK